MSRRQTIKRQIWMIAVSVAAIAANEVAAATPAPLGSQALYHWLAMTAAQALKASEADNDLRPGGLLAVNQGAKGGLAQIGDLAPDWLAELQPHLTVRDDLSALYGLRARRALYESPAETLMIDAFGGFEVDQAGRTSGEVGIGVDADVDDELFSIDLAGSLDQEWLRRRERYTARVEIDWWHLSLTGSAFNETTMDEPSGALYEERLFDGLDLNLETSLPFVPWLTIRTRQCYRAPTAPNADAWRSSRHSLRLRPWPGLEIEAGTEKAGEAEARWFTSVRYAVKLGA